MMIRRFLLFIALLFTSQAFAQEFGGYVSPESYAVNEADMTDYMYIPHQKRPTIDSLDSMLFDKETGILINQSSEIQQKKQNITNEVKKEKVKRAKGEEKPYEETLKYKFAKWWVDKRYEREEPHHGAKHEIKLNSKYKQSEDNSEQ